ncbi:MAG: 4,5-dioxygenase [Alphaproteobacteria bacterium]|nr:4,5-dioxygenase [Alphaproteobacteria bacterium]
MTNDNNKKDTLRRAWEKAAQKLEGYHIHIYVNPKDWKELNAANTLANNIQTLFGKDVKDVHTIRPVGPHTQENIAVEITKEGFGKIIPWLQLNNKENLSILIHPETGDLRGDHHEAALWLGKPVALNEQFFDKVAPKKANGPRQP